MSRGAATLEEATREMICDRTHWKHSIKAGADFPAPTRQPLPSQKARMNERKMRMIMSANFLKSQRRRAYFCALALCENENQCIAFSNNKQERRQNENKLF